MSASTPPSPTRIAHWHRRARRYLSAGKWPPAQVVLEKLLQRSPDDVSARLSLCETLLRRGSLQAATDHALTLTRPWPSEPAHLLALTSLLLAAGEKAAASEGLDRAPLLHASATASMRQIAHLRFQLGESEAALPWMDRVVAEPGAHREDHHFRALLLQFVGRLDDAKEAVDSCLAQWPAFGSAALTRTRLRRQNVETAQLEYLREQAWRAADSLDRATFNFALFKTLDDIDRCAEAWPALQRANAIMHARNPYDETSDAQARDAIMRHVDAAACRPDSGWQPDGPLPIFIVGMPRSGTTLLDRMLGNHSHVTSAGELSDFLTQWRWVSDIGTPSVDAFAQALARCADVDFRQLGERYLRQTAWRAHGSARFIDKMPGNFQSVGLIHRALPGARILNVVRDPMAVCFSNFKAMLGDKSAHCYEQKILARYYLGHERLRQHWHRVAPGAMLDVSYEALVRSPRDTMQQVLAFCGLGFEDDCAHPARNQAPVATPSSAQVREPIHERGIDEWKRYAAQLAPMRETLEAGSAQPLQNL